MLEGSEQKPASTLPTPTVRPLLAIVSEILAREQTRRWKKRRLRAPAACRSEVEPMLFSKANARTITRGRRMLDRIDRSIAGGEMNCAAFSFVLLV